MHDTGQQILIYDYIFSIEPYKIAFIKILRDKISSFKMIYRAALLLATHSPRARMSVSIPRMVRREGTVRPKSPCTNS